MHPEHRIKGIGIDIESIDRIHALGARYDAKTLSILYTADELQRCRQTQEQKTHFTIFFAAKEAMSKALGTGFANVSWPEIEVQVHGKNVAITLYRRAFEQAMFLGASSWEASWSRYDNHVMVQVIVYSHV